MTISGLQISNGYKVCGGGIINNHELTLRRVVPGNKAVLGAGVYNLGPNTDGADGSRVTVEDGIISANDDGLGGSDSPGGISTSNKMTVMIERSTISANTGEGIDNSKGRVAVEGSTTSANTEGGIQNSRYYRKYET